MPQPNILRQWCCRAWLRKQPFFHKVNLNRIVDYELHSSQCLMLAVETMMSVARRRHDELNFPLIRPCHALASSITIAQDIVVTYIFIVHLIWRCKLIMMLAHDGYFLI